MQEVFISGQVGRAIYINDGSYYVLDRGLHVREATQRDIHEISQPASGFGIFQLSEGESISQLLERESTLANLLFLVISTYNPELKIATRVTCAKAAEEMLSDELTLKVSDRILSARLPSEVRSVRASLLQVIEQFPKLAKLINETFDFQESFDIVEGAFRRATESLDLTAMSELRSELVADGTFAAIVRATKLKTLTEFNLVFVDGIKAKRHPDINGTATAVLTTVRSDLQSLLFGKLEKKEIVSQPSTSGRVDRRDLKSMSLEDLVRTDLEDSFSRLSSFEAKTSVDKQILAIRKQLYDGRLDLVEKYTEELVRFQLTNGERYHIGMSLCLLASAALAANQLEIADRISSAATRLGVEDPVIFTTRAEVLKNLGLFDAALEAYRDAKQRFPDEPYAWNGIADVLKESGRFGEALRAYEEAQRRFPEESVAFNGHVATLNVSGNLKAAIKEARRTVTRFPQDAVSQATLAGVLSSAGKFGDAVKHYKIALALDGKHFRIVLGYINTLNRMGDSHRALGFINKAISRERENIILRNLLASQYRTMGKIDPALTITKEVLTKAPGYLPARWNLASILLLKGEVQQAIRELPQSNLRSEADWAGYKIFLLSLISIGDYKASATKLAWAIETCPWIKMKSKFQTIFGFVQGRLGNKAEAVRNIETDIESLDQHQKQTRLAILGDIRAQNGDRQIAETILSTLVVSREPQIVAFRKSALAGRPTKDVILPLLLAA